MVYHKEDRYKVFGLSLVIFILLLLILWLMPRAGIDSWAYNGREIDSIHVVMYGSFSYTQISGRAEIDTISAKVRNCKPVEVKAIKISKLPFQIILYSQKRKATLDFLDGHYDGKIIETNGVDYRNDELWDLVNTYYLKINAQ